MIVNCHPCFPLLPSFLPPFLPSPTIGLPPLPRTAKRLTPGLLRSCISEKAPFASERLKEEKTQKPDPQRSSYYSKVFAEANTTYGTECFRQLATRQEIPAHPRVSHSSSSDHTTKLPTYQEGLVKTSK